MKTREDIVKEAQTWLRTPYVHCADVKGQGVDCAMILVRVFCDLGFVAPFDPRPYSTTWFLHKDEELYLGWIEKYAHKVHEPLPGDIVLYKIGRTASHGGIVVAPGYMIHAYQPNKKVELCELRSGDLGPRLHSYWSVFP